MNKKLTLSLDTNIIDFAHDYSKKSRKSISEIIENYFLELKTGSMPEIPGEVAELYGILEGVDVPDKKELRREFHEDHLNWEKEKHKLSEEQYCSFGQHRTNTTNKF